MHLSVILDFYQCSQGPDVRHMICRLPKSKIMGDIPLSLGLPSTHVVDTLFGQCPVILIMPCSVCGTNSRNMIILPNLKFSKG